MTGVRRSKEFLRLLEVTPVCTPYLTLQSKIMAKCFGN